MKKPDIEIGANLKALRQKKGISMKEIGQNIGVSVSFLSQVESGKTVPSVATLRGIANYLNTTISYLMGEQNFVANPVVHARDRKTIDYARGISMSLLTSQDKDKQMEPLLFKISPQADSGPRMYRHFGQEFVLVLKGVLEIKLNDQKYILKKGDSIYFNSSTPHSFRNLKKGATEAIWVDTPPTF